MTELMNFAQSVAREAGELILCEREQADLVHDYKGGNELVTNADIKADQLIRTRIEQRFAEHRLLSEESSPELQRVWESEVPVWIVDPIDGTVNYAHGHIQSAVSIAYCEHGQITLGVVYNPFTDELFSAELGQGAKLNGATIRVAEETIYAEPSLPQGFRTSKKGLTTWWSGSEVFFIIVPTFGDWAPLHSIYAGWRPVVLTVITKASACGISQRPD